MDRAERDRQIIELVSVGRTSAQIAKQLGLTDRTVQRIRRKHGISNPWIPPMSDEEIRLADQMLHDGCSYKEVADTLGKDRTSICKRFPGRGWPPSSGAEARKMNQLLQQCGVLYGIN